ncbi:MAG: response regulator [Bacteroidota bacterium]
MTKIRLLLVEDDETDALLVIRQLKKDGFEVEHVRVKTRPDMEAELDKGGWDIVISDYAMPGFSGQEALKLFKSRNLDIPFILVSGTVGEDLAVSIMKGGANDYMMKSALNRLGPAVNRELEEMQVRIDKKQAQKELIIAKLAAEESSRVKSSLLANMSHEFRTPMNGILGFTEMLSSMISDESQKMMTKHILTSALRLMRTLNSIVTFAQLDSGYSVKLVHVNLSVLLENAVESIREMALQKHLSLNSAIEQGVFIKSDEHLLHISILNILDNAVKFTREGSIDIKLQRVEKPSTDIILSIRDTGIGIPREKQELIFEEFRQASEGYNRPYEGSGLGLSITRKSTLLLNYRLNLESEPMSGSTFTLIIPDLFAQGSADEKPVIIGERHMKRPDSSVEAPLILLVEDNDANIDLVRMYLKKDYKLDFAKDGLSAIELTKMNRYECILMDINLGPGMDGGEAIEKIRTNPDYASVPIIAVTGYTLQHEKEAILKKGANHYLPKPFNKDQLTEILHQVLGIKVNG